MSRGIVGGYDKTIASGYIKEKGGQLRDFSAIVGDIEQDEAERLYNGAHADYTPYTSSHGGLRARDIRLAASSGLAAPRSASPRATSRSPVTAIIIRYDSSLGGFLRDETTGDEIRFSDRVVTPASAQLKEGDRVTFTSYAKDRRGVWAKSVKLTL